MEKCIHNEIKDFVGILVSKKRCIITKEGIFIKKGCSKKNAIIKINGVKIPNGINVKNYNCFFIDKKSVEHIPYFNE